MELFISWPFVLVFGAVTLFAVLQWKFPILNPRRWNDRPTHYSETEDGKGRHQERMQGLRAMADDIKAQETETSAADDSPRAVKPGEESVAEEQEVGHW